MYHLEKKYFLKCCECAREHVLCPPRVTLRLTEVRSRAGQSRLRHTRTTDVVYASWCSPLSGVDRAVRHL